MTLHSFCWNFEVFFSFLISTLSVRLLGRGISPSQGLYLHTELFGHRIKARRHPWLEWDYPTIQTFERLKSVHALDRASTVFDRIGRCSKNPLIILMLKFHFLSLDKFTVKLNMLSIRYTFNNIHSFIWYFILWFTHQLTCHMLVSVTSFGLVVVRVYLERPSYWISDTPTIHGSPP
jgi:hypothetical protein